jgi:hypothetical protein
MPASESAPTALLASALRDWQRVVSDYAGKPRVFAVAPGLGAYRPTPAPRQSPGSRPGRRPDGPVTVGDGGAQYRWLEAQRDLAREMRQGWEQQIRELRRAGAPRTSQGYARSGMAAALGHESALESQLAVSAGQLGRYDLAGRAARNSQGLADRMRATERAAAEGPLRDMLDQARAWGEQLGARIAVLDALRAPEEDILRLTRQRVAALQQEAEALRALGLAPQAERATARALRLAGAEAPRGRRADAIDRRVREVLGSDPRNAERVTPLAVARAERMGAAADVGVREESVGLDRRLVVELRAPRDLGNAAVDALVNEVMTRVVDALRCRR